MTIDQNILAKESSSYLQQHKANPVNWQIWNKQVLQLAKNKKRGANCSPLV